MQFTYFAHDSQHKHATKLTWGAMLFGKYYLEKIIIIFSIPVSRKKFSCSSIKIILVSMWGVSVRIYPGTMHLNKNNK